MFGKLLGSGNWTARGLCSEAPLNGERLRLPWSVIQPFGSIRVNLTEAYSSGWNEVDDFPKELESECTL